MRRILFTTLALIVATWATLVVGPSAASASTAGTAAVASTASAATLAAANFNKTAGTCAQNPTSNSLGGSQFEHSCAGGYSGGPEYWCADFAKWVWRNSGLDVSGLTAAAQSFYTYGQSHGTFHSTAQPGDAVVYSSSPGGYADHVAIVTAVNADGSVVTANGDWGGQSGTMAHFAVTSSVVKVTIPASAASTGSWVAAANYYITGIVGASGSGGSAPPEGSGSPYSPGSICGSGYGVVDSHDLGAATVFLLYDDDSGMNCVVTLADADGGKVAMNATLTVQGGTPQTDPGSYDWYAGPVTAYAPNACVQWGGTYKTSTWTSDYGHCGSGGGSPAPSASNPYSAAAACGTGYEVVDHHALSGATVYLMFNGSTGNNCVVTLYTDVAGKVAGKASLTVQGGAPVENSGSFTYYAGPVTAYAPNSCVKWGGAYGSSSWTSDYGHCGSGTSTANPYTPEGVCGAGYSVIDSHSVGSATVYLLYNAGRNCVVTMVNHGNGPVGLNATLTVQGGTPKSNPGLFEWYAGPLTASAASACVQWGGSYESTSWLSGWTHCG
jgi:hypothetical protein